MIEVQGIVISERPYGETSKIINIMTLEYGIIGIMAKGSRTMKSDLRSVTTKLSYGKFNIYYKKDKLSTLVSVDIIDNFKNIRRDISLISYASYLLDLSEQVLKQTYTNVYGVLISGLIKINELYDPLVITNIIELKYLEHLGVMPSLDGCVVCGKQTNIVTLSSDKGGYICNGCYINEKMVDEKTIKLIRMFYYVDIDKISKLDVSESVKKEINDFLNNYYDRYTGLYLNSKQFLKNLTKLGK